MFGFFASFQPILKQLKKYRLELIFICIATILAFASFMIFFKNMSDSNQNVFEETTTLQKSALGKIMVEVAGAVKKPDVYELSEGTRLKDFIKAAGGLAEEADKTFFNRNFNLARFAQDQEKIYIPSSWEINQGIFIENKRTLEYLEPIQTTSFSNSVPSTSAQLPQLISINSSTIQELDTLPGVGQTTAQKIIQNRPYGAIEDLVNRKVINKGVWEKIKEQITN